MADGATGMGSEGLGSGLQMGSNMPAAANGMGMGSGLQMGQQAGLNLGGSGTAPGLGMDSGQGLQLSPGQTPFQLPKKGMDYSKIMMPLMMLGLAAASRSKGGGGPGMPAPNFNAQMGQSSPLASLSPYANAGILRKGS